VLASIKKGFTLIELLIVVAIIAILAAIAVPNFLEAQTRSKVSRAKADMRTIVTGLEAYHIDYNSYIPCSTFGINGRGVNVAVAQPVFERLSSPVAYLTSGIIPNPFSSNSRGRLSAADASGMAASTPTQLTPAEKALPEYNSFLYQSGNDYGRTAYSGSTGAASMPAGGTKAVVYFLHSPGPDGFYYNLGGVLANSTRTPSGTATSAGSDLGNCTNLIYDPTNGTISFGAIWRMGGQTNSAYGYFLSQAAAQQR
jgi:prepilin-type N-terminal cleavage/methylation domain-containing protein